MTSNELLNFAATAVPPQIWLWGALTLLMTAAIGFVSGVWYARSSTEWAFQRASRHVTRVFELVIETLEKSQQACQMLEKFPNLLLSAEQLEQLEVKRSRLQGTVARVVEAQSSTESDGPLAIASKNIEPVDLQLEWLRSPEDSTTGLPDRTAFDANLEKLLELGTQEEACSGLLLIKVDKLGQLKRRFDEIGAKHFLRKMAGVVCRSLREEDVVCQFNDDTFGVLMPGAGSGGRLADAIRDSVRAYHFRLDESGPEVLVTASFGYTTCLPHDHADVVLNRAGNALAKSQQRGRNQLHVNDGHKTVHCIAG